LISEIDIPTLLIYLLGFLWIVIASTQVSKYFQKIKLPLITGFLLSGIVVGPFVLDLIPKESVDKLGFVYDFSLAYIAFAAGAELYLKELRGSMKSIIWNTIGQLVITFVLSTIAIYLLANLIPFMHGMSTISKLAVAILGAVVFVARSPSSAIAIINEMRAKGHFTKTAISVTVVKDVLVIILFAICFSFSDIVFKGATFNALEILVIFLELAVSFVVGYILSKLMRLFLSLRLNLVIKTVLILLSGFAIFVFSNHISHVVIFICHLS